LTTPLVLAHPGDLESRTGGWGYDRRLVAEFAALGRPVRAIRLPGSYPDVREADRAAARTLFAGLPDGTAVVVDMMAGGVLPDLLADERKRLAIVALCHHPLALETGLDPGRAAELADSERRALRSARRVVVTSPVTAETVATMFTVLPERIVVAVPGTDPQPAAPGGNEPPVLLTVATLTRRKAHDVLIDSLARISDLSFEARFVGGDRFDPDWTAALHARVEQAGLADRVHFLGEVDDPGPQYREADLFVLPSRYEGYGMVFAEALAHGLPVVAARGGAVPTVVPEEAGRLVPVDDPDALADALRVLLTDPGARHRARAAARRAGFALLRWDDTARRVAGAVDAAIQERENEV
jgi:glycosyltransferase involved in cell wall biosynthesis